jgi:hypothetical protein
MSGRLTAEQMLKKVWSVSERLEAKGVWHEIRTHRYDAVTILAHVPGQYWEIDFLEDGSVDVEVFRSTQTLEDESAIERLIDENREPNEEE